MSAAEGAHTGLSVVIVRFVGGPLIGRTLDALMPQLLHVHGEVLVAHREDDPPSPELRSLHPAVRWVAGARDASPARLRTLGVAAATGAIVACTEDHCTPGPTWCARIVEAQARQSAVIGGAIDKAPSDDGAAWAAYLLDYGRYMSPLSGGPADYVSDCNVSYPRTALGAVEDQWREEFHETTVHWALRSHGLPLLLDPSIVVIQDRTVVQAEYLAERRDHGRVFARTRMMAGASPLLRLRYILIALMLPPVIVRRIKRGLSARGHLSVVPAAAWPSLRYAARAWARGELQGYLEGT
jgi:hypothetical protein